MSRHYELLKRLEQELAQKETSVAEAFPADAPKPAPAVAAQKETSAAEAFPADVPTSASPVAAQNQTRVAQAFPADVPTSASPVAAQNKSSVAEAFPAGVPTSASGSSPAAETQSSFTPSTVERLLAQCPRLTWNPDPHTLLTINSEENALGAEEFRSLRSFVYLVREQRKLRRLLITSSLPREGKTFTALNLAHAIACQPQHRVLLIDSDLRLSKLHAVLGTTSTPGLSDYLSGETDEFSILQRSALENLFFIPAGKPASNPCELIGNGRLKLLLDRLAPAIDWIILDSPPVLPVSDAKLLAELCDAVLLVVQAGVTPYDLAQKACRQFRDQQLLAAVLNRAAPSHTYTSYYYHDRDGGTGNGKRPVT